MNTRHPLLAAAIAAWLLGAACATTKPQPGSDASGVKYHCEYEAPTGSNIPRVRCLRLTEAEAQRQADQEAMRRAQQKQSSGPGTSLENQSP